MKKKEGSDKMKVFISVDIEGISGIVDGSEGGRDKGEYEKALEYHRTALMLLRQNIAQYHSSFSTVYINIADVYKQMTNYDEAIVYYDKALELYEKYLGLDNMYDATAYLNIGSVYDYKQEYEKALSYYNKALPLYMKLFGEDHSFSATLFKAPFSLSVIAIISSLASFFPTCFSSISRDVRSRPGL